jgi:uncharacterized surface protein with fasciclin (FAS1) repeats
MRSNDTRPRFAAIAAASLLALAACSQSSDTADKQGSPAAAPSGKTLADAISDTDDLSTVSGALRETGLAQVFDGAGSYTMLAPTDAAFAKLGDAAKSLGQADNKAEMAAILRDHIVPGYLTPDDIKAAIDAQHGSAKVATMGDHKLTFTRSGDGLVVTGDDGSRGTIAGEAIKAGNGVAIPVDGVLKKLAPAA